MQLLYQEQTGLIIRALYNVYNRLGYGYREKEYQKGLVGELEKLGLDFDRELYCNLKYDDKIIFKFFIDFLIKFANDKIRIVVELKVAEEFHKKYFDQVMTYLKTNGLELGLLAIFTRKNVLIKRIINQEIKSA